MILAIDQGTSGTTALAVDAAAQVAGRGYATVHQQYPRPGWVEHDAAQIWDSVCTASRAALAQAGGPSLAAIGVANQRETAVAWNARTG
ncbi:MAG: glycerol kinase, partial [Actinobacteria bacterium]|nr:glycerol kinase [Actinomycetota bacterium]